MLAAVVLDAVVVALPLVSERVVGSHHQRVSLQFSKNHLVDELLVRHFGKIQRKGLYQHHINALFLNLFQIVFHRVDGKKRGFGTQNGAGVRREGHHHASAVDLFRLLAQKTQNTDMPEVHTVECTDGHHRIRESRQLLCSVENLHQE